MICFFHIWELGASRYAKNTPTGCRNIFPYRQSHPQDFPKIDILYICPISSPTQNFRSSISPNSRAREAGIHTKACGTSNILERMPSLFQTNSGESSYRIFRRKNVEKHPKSPTYQMWNEYNVFLKNTLLKIGVYYI